MNEFQKALRKWTSSLTNQQLAKYIEDSDNFSDAEFDALIFEDLYRMSANSNQVVRNGSWIKGTEDDDEEYEYIPSAAELS